jgi:phosphate:Na+ symporter
MSLWNALATLLGGLGVFLLGMAMMTDGLKLAAGSALQHILGLATRTRWQALGSGILLTALVQSSTAVGVAAIGFVNAGLLTLRPAMWVVFGANVGTSMTSWIVALVGLKFKVEALALPMIGVGALLRMTGQNRRSGAIGTALAGFGLLFLGIGLLQASFGGLSDRFSLPQGEGTLVLLSQLLVGLMMTVVMQSSSAAMTITLTAAQSSLIDTQGAAAVVIGANMGSAVTTALAGIGATSNARRTALAHVLFNVLTGAVALLLLPWLVGFIVWVREGMQLPPDPAITLALFHTAFNVLGVVLMWPLGSRLAQWLKERFRQREEDEALPRFLDKTVLSVPELALDALAQELARHAVMCQVLVHGALAGDGRESLEGRYRTVQQLSASIEGFAERLSQLALTAESSERLAHGLRVHRDQANSARLAMGVTPLIMPSATATTWQAQHQAFVQALRDGDHRRVQACYEPLKSTLLWLGATGQLALAPMEAALTQYSDLRKIARPVGQAQAPSEPHQPR